MKRLATVVIVGALLVAACGDDAETSDVPTTQDPAAGGDQGATFPADTPGPFPVSEVIDSSGTIRVVGYVFVLADGSVVIADAIAESFPPQPAAAQIEVSGLDLTQVPLVEGPADAEIAVTQWTDMPVELIGEVVDGVFVGNSVASA